MGRYRTYNFLHPPDIHSLLPVHTHVQKATASHSRFYFCLVSNLALDQRDYSFCTQRASYRPYMSMDFFQEGVGVKNR